MNKPKLRMAALAVILSGTTALSGPAHADTLIDALVAAYNSNPTLLAQRAGLRATDEGVARANSDYRPSVQGTVDLNYSDTSSTTVRSDGLVVSDVDVQGRGEDYTIRADQQVFRGLQTLNNVRENKRLVLAGRAQLLSTEQQVLLGAVTAYMDVLRDEAVLRLNDNNVQVLNRQLEASRDRFRVGEITRTDVAQSEARLAGAVSQRIQSEADLETSRSAYQNVVGSYPGTLENVPALPPLPSDLEEATQISLDENPSILAAEYNEEAAKYAVKEAKGALFPSISAFAQYNRNESPTVTFDPDVLAFASARNQRTSSTVGGRLTVPLYQSGAVSSDIRRAKQIRSQRLLEIRVAERQAQQDVRTAWEQYRAAKASIESNQSQVRANEIALEGVRQEAAVGSRTTLDVLDAEQELLDSRVNLVRAERNEYVAAFTLISAIGRLNARALGLPVDIYEPADNFDSVKWQLYGWGTED